MTIQYRRSSNEFDPKFDEKDLFSKFIAIVQKYIPNEMKGFVSEIERFVCDNMDKVVVTTGYLMAPAGVVPDTTSEDVYSPDDCEFSIICSNQDTTKTAHVFVDWLDPDGIMIMLVNMEQGAIKQTLFKEAGNAEEIETVITEFFA